VTWSNDFITILSLGMYGDFGDGTSIQHSVLICRLMSDLEQKLHVAIVCDTVPYPTRSGDNQRIAELISFLRAEGCFVHLVLSALIDKQMRDVCVKQVDALHLYNGTGFKTRSRNFLRRAVRLFDRIGKRIGIPPAEEMASRVLGRNITPLVINYWQRYPEGLDKFAARLAARYQWKAVIVEYLWLHRTINGLPDGVATLLDTHDIQYKRAEEFASRGMTFPLSVTREEEARIYSQFDAVIAIQNLEASLIREMCPSLEVLTVGSTGSATRPSLKHPIPGRILYVGGYNGANIDGLRHFFTAIWPRILARSDQAHLRICGYIYRAFLGERFEKVDFLGHMEDLEEEYAEASLVINPSWIGTGLKIKSVEALARWKPLVTTSKGVEGLDGDVEKACIVSDVDDQFVKNVIELVVTPTLSEKLSEAAKAFAQTHLAPNIVYKELVDFLRR